MGAGQLSEGEPHLRVHYSSSTSVVRRFLIDKEVGATDQISVFIDSNEEVVGSFSYVRVDDGS